ncbi:protein THYLAKOID ASSEMBLY 8-like, chloroplastic isoform X2 [Brassica napus]|uniref:protein THYLAKOID ASSEMBLY 8-like, chloroplastic isoform X2 n=1 Tax=Brassica napus TaxID=3708 RepID=UPI0020791E7A|nr:protein THYLAKOID ASSEMBLY 8-like, chloroplastic isoform X2 [Brassica napus]
MRYHKVAQFHHNQREMAAIRVLSRKLPTFASIFFQTLTRNPSIHRISFLNLKPYTPPKPSTVFVAQFHDGRPRGPLWRGKKLIGKEALFVILGLKRLKEDDEKLEKFVKTHVFRLLKLDMLAVIGELERQEETALAIKMFEVIQKQEWYQPDVFMYKDLIVSLAKSKRMDEAMGLWEKMKKENLFPDSQTYTEVIRGFLRDGCPADAMNVYEDMLKSPDPPEELPFRVLLKGLLPHPLLRNKVKKDFEELFPEKHAYDPPEEIFGRWL